MRSEQDAEPPLGMGWAKTSHHTPCVKAVCDVTFFTSEKSDNLAEKKRSLRILKMRHKTAARLILAVERESDLTS